jgi:hypothetical protein
MKAVFLHLEAHSIVQRASSLAMFTNLIEGLEDPVLGLEDQVEGLAVVEAHHLPGFERGGY